MRSIRNVLVAAAFITGAATAAAANGETFALSQERERAEFAMYALSDRYSAIWATLDSPAKAAFSARERAWLNEGRRVEQRACALKRGAADENSVVWAACLAEVTEQRLAALGGGAPPLRLVRQP